MDKLDAGRLKAAVFDWDGTLAETRTPRLWAVNRIMAKYGLPDWESTREKQNKLLSFMDNFPLVFGSRAEEAYREYAELYKANVARMIKTFPGVRETLAFLRQKGVKIAIMTNKDRRLLEFELPLLFDVSLFDRIVCGHEAAHDKPCGDHARYLPDDILGHLRPEGIGCGKRYCTAKRVGRRRQRARQHVRRSRRRTAGTDCRRLSGS